MNTKKGLLLFVIGLLLLSACAPAYYGAEPVYLQENLKPRPTSPPPFDDQSTEDINLNPPNDEPYNDMFFKNYGVNPRIDTEDDQFATFGLDVDTGSYTLMRSYIESGDIPPTDSVRVEEYLNYFEQEYPVPESDAFGIYLEGAPMPYDENGYQLVRVGIQAYDIPEEDREDVVLTFVIDISGSMDIQNRLGLVKDALEILIEELRPSDEIGIVVYGSNARVVLKHTPISEKQTISQAIRHLHSGGSTNAEAGLTIGYRLARDNFKPEAINRVILCSDGVANVGATGPNSIMKRIEKYAEENIYLTTVGFGMGNYNDVLMEQLADTGEGFYAYVDTIEEAERIFVHDLTSTLMVVAKDAKVQVEFNPEIVSRYRLIGYENRDIEDEDFRDDQVDAGEIGAGHSVTALIEVKFFEGVPTEEQALTVRLRYKDVNTEEVIELENSISKSEFHPNFEDASSRFQLDALVVQYAEVLRNSYWAKEINLDDIANDMPQIVKALSWDTKVQEFAQLVRRATKLNNQTED